MRNRIFARAGGLHPTMLTFAAANDYPDRRDLLIERGLLLLPEISLLNIYDHYRSTAGRTAGSGKQLKDLSRHTVIEQMFPDGSPWRVVHSLPGGRHIADYLRPDGTVYLRIPIFDFRKAETWPRKIRRVAESGETAGSFDSLGEWFRGWVRELTVGDERAFLHGVEGRRPAPGADAAGGQRPPGLSPAQHASGPTATVGLPARGKVLRQGSGRDPGHGCDGHAHRAAATGHRPPPWRHREPVRRTEPGGHAGGPGAEVTGSSPDRGGGPLEPQKRLAHALRAFARVVESVPDAHFDIYGRGPLSAMLAQLARELGIERSVTLHGHDPNARDCGGQPPWS